MLDMIGSPADIDDPIIGIVTSKNVGFFNRHNRILVASKPPRAFSHYAGVITSDPNPGKYRLTPQVYNVNSNEIKKLNDGDIVFIEPNGRISQVWDSSSPHNAIFATDACNSACIMCPQPRKKVIEDRTETNLKILKLLDPKKTKSIGITGGEPTLLGEGLVKLIMECKKRLPNVPIMILTNGKLFDDISFVESLSNIGHSDITFCIPLYSDTDREHDKIVGSKGSFNKTIMGIMNLARFKQKVEVRNVLIKQNINRLYPMAEFIYRNMPFVTHIAFMGMETTGLAIKNLNKVWVDPLGCMEQLKEAVLHLYRREMNVSIYNLQLCIMPPELWPFSRQSISAWKNTYIDKCNQCRVRETCCGFFSTSGDHMSSGISTII